MIPLHRSTTNGLKSMTDPHYFCSPKPALFNTQRGPGGRCCWQCMAPGWQRQLCVDGEEHGECAARRHQPPRCRTRHIHSCLPTAATQNTRHHGNIGVASSVRPVFSPAGEWACHHLTTPLLVFNHLSLGTWGHVLSNNNGLVTLHSSVGV